LSSAQVFFFFSFRQGNCGKCEQKRKKKARELLSQNHCPSVNCGCFAFDGEGVGFNVAFATEEEEGFGGVLTNVLEDFTGDLGGSFLVLCSSGDVVFFTHRTFFGSSYRL
jgi:hypothetical protein